MFSAHLNFSVLPAGATSRSGKNPIVKHFALAKNQAFFREQEPALLPLWRRATEALTLGGFQRKNMPMELRPH